MRARRRGQARPLPLRYFDGHPHGDMLSRVTNDIDNITTTLQQGLSQLLTSVLTILGVLVMMFWISPLLAAVSLVVIPLSILVTFLIARKSQVQFAAQWARTGSSTATSRRRTPGHMLVKVFGQQRGADRRVRRTRTSTSTRRASGRSSSPGSSSRR